MELLNIVRQRGRPSIQISPTNVDIVGGQTHTITCSVQSISAITDVIWIKSNASSDTIVNVVGVDGKFSGGTLSDPSLTINNIAKSDEGIYVCRATNWFGTALSEDSVLTCKECIEVEIVQKGPITVGYGGTIKINANIISNSTGSLEINWQKTHNNCSTTLMINCFKYFGSSCDVNNPRLVINNVDKEDAGIYKLEVISPTETKSSPGILLELHGDEAEALSKEENNFFRFYFLCQKIATQAVRFFFDGNVPGHTLESFLKQHKSNLTSHGSVYRCTKDQEVKLFPGGQVVSTDFDFTLLYKLIRHLLTAIPAPACKWGNKPSPGHLNETDDIERIRDLRNKLAHKSDLEICDTDFFTHWTDLSQAIDRLSKSSLSKAVKSLRTKSFDKCIKNEMEEDIRKEQTKIREEFMELQQQVDKNTQEIHNIKTRNKPINIYNGQYISININKLVFGIKSHICEQLLSQKITEAESVETECATSTPQTSQPQSTESKNEKSVETECATSTPQTSQPQSTQSKNEKSVETECATSTPQTSQPQSTQSKNEKSVETECATSTPQTSQPQSTQSKNEKSVETECATSTPQTSQPQSTQSKNEKSVETECATSTPQTSQPQSTQSKNENKCCVEWKLATPDTWNVSKIKDTLQKYCCSILGCFQIESVDTGSLVIRTIVPEHILSNYDDFKSAVRSFLAKIVEVCQLDTDTPKVVKVDLNIFTEILPTQQSAQVEPVSGTSWIGPTTFQQDQSAKKKPMKSNNENEGDVSTIPQESDESDMYDGVVLHAEDDRDAAIEFITNMERENPDLNIDITIYENLQLGTSVFESPAKLFDSCRYLFVFVTQNFVEAELEKFLLIIATMETLTFQEKNARLIPVKTDKTDLSVLAPLQSLKYDNYLKAKKSQQGPDQYFIKCFRDLITHGRKKYLVN